MLVKLRSKVEYFVNLIKRIFDIVFALLALVVLSPAVCLIALLIKKDSRGPVLYRALRAGQYGKPFYINKFRTMILNAEKLGGNTTGLCDPRITRVGALLRRYKLDELPQFFNVIKGDMSIVGPRPEVLVYVKRYSEAEKCILKVKPGVTDLSSVFFHSLAEHVGSADPDSIFETQILPVKNRLRIQYATEHSFFLDLRIILATVRVIVTLFWRDMKGHFFPTPVPISLELFSPEKLGLRKAMVRTVLNTVEEDISPQQLADRMEEPRGLRRPTDESVAGRF